MLLEEGVQVGEERHRSTLASIRRRQRSSWSVHPFCTFNYRRVGPTSYRLVSSLATRLS
jgi:hypothetical protein